MVSATAGATRMPDAPAGADGYVLRTATAQDVGGARAVMLDTVYHDLRSGYVPRWHADIIDLEGAYLLPERCTLLVVVRGGEVVATGAVRDRGPQAPPNPQWVADRFPSGSTAQLCRIYVRPEHRRHGLARRLVRELGDFAARAAWLHLALPAHRSGRAGRRAVLAVARPGGLRRAHAAGRRSGHRPLRAADARSPGPRRPAHQMIIVSI